MGDAYDEALEAHGLGDLQPLYRGLLRRLKSADPARYEEAVARYRDEVEPAVEAPDGDPVRVWLDYGVWLASRIAEGSLMTIEENGRAADAGGQPPVGPMLIHLPSDRKRRGFVLAMPADPTPAQRETASLLCEPM